MQALGQCIRAATGFKTPPASPRASAEELNDSEVPIAVDVDDSLLEQRGVNIPRVIEALHEIAQDQNADQRMGGATYLESIV